MLFLFLFQGDMGPVGNMGLPGLPGIKVQFWVQSRQMQEYMTSIKIWKWQDYILIWREYRETQGSQDWQVIRWSAYTFSQDLIYTSDVAYQKIASQNKSSR